MATVAYCGEDRGIRQDGLCIALTECWGQRKSFCPTLNAAPNSRSIVELEWNGS